MMSSVGSVRWLRQSLNLRAVAGRGERSYARTVRELAPGVVDYDGLLLDGWMIVEDELV